MKVRSIVSDPSKVAGCTILREIPGQGYEVEWEISDKIPESKVYKLLKKIADKIEVEE